MKELEDYHWFPPVLRNFQTDFIGFVVSRFSVYDGFIQHIKNLPMPLESMSDLCSGSGEPAISIFKKSKRFSRLLLSDKYPSALSLKDENIFYKTQPTDVLAKDFTSETCYTMFNAFHHFSDEEKVKIVQKMQVSGADAFIVEILEPTVFCLLKVVFTTTIGTLLFTPFIAPFSAKRLFFTYILPVNVFTITYDGIVSVLKSRTAEQSQNLFANSGNAVKVFRLKSRLSTLVVIQISSTK
jgi:hypothetical protein